MMNVSITDLDEMIAALDAAVRMIDEQLTELSSVRAKTASWNDANGEQFRAAIERIAKTTKAPRDQLIATAKKVRMLRQLVEQYNRVRF